MIHIGVVIEWDGPPDQPKLLLVDRLATEGMRAPITEWVRPLEGSRGSGLFRTFANLSDDDLPGFASRNSRLGIPGVEGRLSNGRVVSGEPVFQWREERTTLAAAIERWDAFRESGDLSAARDLAGYFMVFPMNRPECAARVVMTPDRDRPLALKIIAPTLLGALWLQFMLAVDGQKQYRACATCGQFFELDPAVARTNRRYCSDACKSRAYRARRDRQES